MSQHGTRDYSRRMVNILPVLFSTTIWLTIWHVSTAFINLNGYNGYTKGNPPKVVNQNNMGVLFKRQQQHYQKYPYVQQQQRQQQQSHRHRYRHYLQTQQQYSSDPRHHHQHHQHHQHDQHHHYLQPESINSNANLRRENIIHNSLEKV